MWFVEELIGSGYRLLLHGARNAALGFVEDFESHYLGTIDATSGKMCCFAAAADSTSGEYVKRVV